MKQLQNSLAHQRLAQSRTSLDDSEYSTRFNRLDGLIAQLAFSIRKSWKSVPSWLGNSVNKDATQTGKQEMTAAGRAFISCWLVEDVFDMYFHPDLDPALSAQLKTILKNIRRLAPPCQTQEDEEFLTAKVVNWRLATLDGLQEMLRSQQSANHRLQLIELLKERLIKALQVHLDNPPMSDLEGGVHMIIELAVSMTTHLPLESRDVQIDYFMPGDPVSTEMMKLETGIPALGLSVAEDAAERMSRTLFLRAEIYADTSQVRERATWLGTSTPLSTARARVDRIALVTTAARRGCVWLSVLARRSGARRCLSRRPCLPLEVLRAEKVISLES